MGQYPGDFGLPGGVGNVELEEIRESQQCLVNLEFIDWLNTDWLIL